MPETPEHSIDTRREYENIQTPEELLAFLDTTIRYGFVGKNNRFYTPDDPAWATDFDREYYLQSPDHMLESKLGVCWDDVELERQWFTEHGFQPETYFLMYAKEGGTNLPTHTFLIFEANGRWFWFEHSFADQRGLHAYTSRQELIDDVKQKHHAYAAQHRGATEEDFQRLRVTTYEQPDYGSSAHEFVTTIIAQDSKHRRE